MLTQKQFFMYNKNMKKILVLLVTTSIILAASLQNSCDAKVFAKQREKIEQKRIEKSTIKDIEHIIKLEEKYANEQNLSAIRDLYSDNYMNSDGFDKKAYLKMVEETWKAYPNISYTTKINKIEFNDNYATVFADETAVGNKLEEIGEFDVLGELYSRIKCVYHLEKRNKSWLITSERVIEEKTSLKFGDARYLNITLDVPKQVGPNKQYSAILKVDAPADTTIVGSISREKIIYPQTKSDDAFRLMEDNILERMFVSNSDNVNEYAVASIGVTHAAQTDENRLRVYMSGMAFIMARVNVIPKNKFINIEDDNG